MIRSYSLSAEPGSAEYRISVKREPNGAASTYLHDHVQAGDTIDVAAPRGVFTLASGDGAVVLASAGIGVTPVLAMLHTLAAERSTREVWWLHGARNSAEHAFAQEARALVTELPHARSYICYSRPAPGDRPGETYTSPGRLSAELLGRLGMPRHADAYLCGPQAFMGEINAALVDLGFAPARIHTEVFGALGSITPGVSESASGPPHPPSGPPGDGPTVSFARSNLTVKWRRDYPALLELAEACDVPTRWSCRTGVCHTCETPVLAGSVTYSPEPIDAPGDGNVLTCCAQPQSDLVLDM
jgi:ferredoxin-NADP reductase